MNEKIQTLIERVEQQGGVVSINHDPPAEDEHGRRIDQWVVAMQWGSLEAHEIGSAYGTGATYDDALADLVQKMAGA